MSDQQAGEDWILVWRQSGHDSDIDADLAVLLLEGSDIPVVRIPASTAPIVFDGFGGPLLPVELFVPPDRAEDAQELLGGAAHEEVDPAEA